MDKNGLCIIDDGEEDCFVFIEKDEKGCHKALSTHELLLNIFCSVPIKNILKMRLVCRLWNDVLQDDHTWQKLFETKYDKVPNPLFLDGHSYKSITLFKEFHENKLWNNALSIIKEPTTSPKLQKYRLFGAAASLTSYLYDVINTSIIENGMAIAFVAQRPLLRDERVIGGITVQEERPTLSNTDFTLVPNIEIEVYLKIIKFDNKGDEYRVRLCDIQRLTATQDNIGRDVNWIKNTVRMEFGKEYYMYSLDVSLGTCKIFSYEMENSLCNFNVDTPPILEMALSNNMLIVLTESGTIQITTKSIIKRHRQGFVDLSNNEKFSIRLKDAAALDQRSSRVSYLIGQVPKANIHSFYLDQNDFMIIGYANTNGENVFRCWDFREITNHLSFNEDFDYRKYAMEFSEILPAKARSFAIRWRNSKNGSYEHNSYSKQQENIIPEIIVTCSGGLILIYHPVMPSLRNQGKTQNKLKLMCKISTGLTSCKMIDTSFWSKENFPKDGEWLFVSAKKSIGDMKSSILLQFLLPKINIDDNRDVTSYGYTSIDGYNPNEEQNLQNTVITSRIQYTHLVHRIISDKIPNAGSIVQVMPCLPHSLLIICQCKEPDLVRPRPKFATYTYDYHNSSFTSNPQHYSPFLYLTPAGYYIMAPKYSFKDDIVFVPFPDLKSCSKSFFSSDSTAKLARPKLVPDGSNRLRVNRKSGTKRGKQPKSTKIDRRKRNQSSKIAYSPRDCDIDYDDDLEDFDDLDDLEEYDCEDDYVYYDY